MIRLFRKSLKAIKGYGLREFLKRLYIFFDRKIRPGRYFHTSSGTIVPSTGSGQARGQETRDGERVLFISGEPKNATSYYRCELPARQLETQGWEVDIVHEDFLDSVQYTVYSHIVFYRTPLNDSNRRVLEVARDKGIKTIFSVDDFVYRRDLLEDLEYTNNLDTQDRERLLNRADGMMELMRQVYAGIASTEYLAKDMRKYINGDVFVNRNGIGGTQDFAFRHGESSKVVLGYFSGSETHDADFEMIWPAIKNILEEYDNVELWLGGRFSRTALRLVSLAQDKQDSGTAKQKINEKIKRLAFMDRERFMQTLGRIDINLFPLENTEFNRGKSEIKFTEAALVGTSTVASPVGDLSTELEAGGRIIRDGETGMLAKDVKEWEEKLRFLIEDGQKREIMGKKANKYVLDNYNLEILGNKLARWIEGLD